MFCFPPRSLMSPATTKMRLSGGEADPGRETLEVLRRRDAPLRGLLLADLGEHVAAGEDEEVLAVDRDLGASVLRVDDGVANGDVHGDDLACVLGAAAGADREHLTLLGLLLGGV